MFLLSIRLQCRVLYAAWCIVIFPETLRTQTAPFLPDSIILQDVVIQATRTSANSPVPHTNISADKIGKIYQAQDVPFLLTATPSLVETSDAGTGTGYTGMRIRGSDPTRINVTINGIPLNDAESQIMYWVDLPDLAASAAEIQVQRGVGTSTNGAGAFGATVNLDLSAIRPEAFATVTNSLGSFGTRKHSVIVGTGLLGGKLAFSGRLSNVASDGFVDRANAALNSYHLTGAYVDEQQSLQAHLLSGHTLTYQAWYGLPAQYLENPDLRTYNPAGTERPDSPYPDEVDDYTQRHYLLHYKRLLSEDLDLQLNGHYTRGFGFYEQYKANQAFAGYGLPPLVLGDTLVEQTDLVRRRRLDNHFYGGTFALRWSPERYAGWMGASPVLMLGGAISHYTGRHFGDVIWAEYAVSKDFVYYDNDADKRDANVFGKIELPLRNGPNLLLDLQFRQVYYQFLGYDQNQNTTNQTAELLFFNPKVGLNWRLGSDWTAYAFFGIGQREPNRDDYTQSTPASRPRSEFMFDWEGGIKRQGENWNFAANLFFMDYRDQLVLDGRINDVGAYIRTNVPRSHRAGIEIEADLRIGERITLSGNAAFSQNKVAEFVEYRDNWDTGEQEAFRYVSTDLAFSPPVVARGEATWALLPVGSKHHFSVSLSGKYVGRQFLDNTGNESTALTAYFFSDLRLNYDLTGIVSKRLSVIFTVQNLFDARYSTNGWVY
ncbi:MAG: TonB-dependent receptor, partial [Saprospiraceae bacterium]